jgi:hypothetical protein
VKTFFYLPGLVFAVLGVACDEEGPTPSQYVAVGQMGTNSYAAICDDSGNKLITDLLVFPFSSFHDGVSDGEYIYLLEGFGFKKLYKVSLHDFTVANIYYTKKESDKASLNFYNNKIYMSGLAEVANLETHAFLSIYDTNLNRVDSISIGDARQCFDAEIADGLIFISISLNQINYIRVMHAETLEVVTDFQIGSQPVGELISAENHEMFALSNTTFYVIDIKNMVMTSHPLQSGIDFESPPSIASTEGLLYHFDYTVQPAPIPYYLKVFDPDYQQDKRITDFSMMLVPPLVFDSRTGSAIASNGSGFSILSKRLNNNPIVIPDFKVNQIIIIGN